MKVLQKQLVRMNDVISKRREKKTTTTSVRNQESEGRRICFDDLYLNWNSYEYDWRTMTMENKRCLLTVGRSLSQPSVLTVNRIEELDRLRQRWTGQDRTHRHELMMMMTRDRSISNGAFFRPMRIWSTTLLTITYWNRGHWWLDQIEVYRTVRLCLHLNFWHQFIQFYVWSRVYTVRASDQTNVALHTQFHLIIDTPSVQSKRSFL